MLKVVKIGGNVVDNPVALERFLRDLAALPDKKILVHGGGKVATIISRSLGIEVNMIDGRRVTDAATLDVVTMVYAGVINKTIVSKLQGFGARAVGLSGADGALITSRRRPPEPVDYGFVGDPERVDTQLLGELIDRGYLPVVAPITYDGAGGLLNTNADTVASALAVALAVGREVELVYCFEKAGVLRDVDDPASLLREITLESYAEFKKAGTITVGMLPKLDNAFRALEQGVGRVVICSSENIGVGTTLHR